MKNFMPLGTLLPFCAAAVTAVSCFKSPAVADGATIRVLLKEDRMPATRAEDRVNTDDYILTVTRQDGLEVYSGRYGDSPETISVQPGSYTVCAVSRVFNVPEYDAPVYGAMEIVVVTSGEVADVSLDCTMKNCGMRLKADAGFMNAFPNAVIYMKSDEGNLLYSYGEKRTGYFTPGKISVSMANEGQTETLFSRTVEERQVLDIGLSASAGGSSDSSAGISIQVDTTKDWIYDNYTYGQDGSMQNALNISEARAAAGTTGVWVYGYIVGDATSTSKIEFDPPYSRDTNIVLGERSTTTDREYCLSVELKSGAIRDALNLVSNSGNKGRKVWLKGDIVSSYYGLPGLKNVTEFSL